ncbi:CDP-glycerol glycerophosphotransferase family protein [Nosocomiicoccus sp. HMSC059G07]|uniref:CDP-glycerol glycerophosphotransferase family protein n=1 Tax=Nosocomiicoccus sp. HMSC059G07 TaxID=1739531 RepID=UPI0008A1518C|nr:CDP-glycerol glycerophosphotransferase family protein [Nosocomiicoccus sp. HMSC059G07]OFO52634.1 hypothetical protein HMPREF3029_02395 [Nosocomiicoccus sp. HMSC059G07]
MIKELFIRVYNFFVSRFFLLMRVLPVKNSVVILTSFGDNIDYIIRHPKMRLYDEVIIFSSCQYDFKTFDNVKVYTQSNLSVKELYEIGRAKNIIVDNHFPVIGGMSTLKPYVNVFQTWHAVGAVKAFGLMDESFKNRPDCAKARFKKTYQNVDYYVAGSKRMADIFKQAFSIDDKKIIKTAMPRLDFYRDQPNIQSTRNSVRSRLKIDDEVIIVTYAPTYRENQFNISDIPLDISKMIQKLPSNYKIALRLHPTVQLDTDIKGVIDLTDGFSLEEVLSVTDILITDYSSVGFEFANLMRPVIYYPYDLDEYTNTKGLIDDYESLVTTNIAYSTDEILEMIKNDDFSAEEIRQFKDLWNDYNNQNNTNTLLSMLQ